jgi:hypothetical protein
MASIPKRREVIEEYPSRGAPFEAQGRRDNPWSSEGPAVARRGEVPRCKVARWGGGLHLYMLDIITI